MPSYPTFDVAMTGNAGHFLKFPRSVRPGFAKESRHRWYFGLGKYSCRAMKSFMVVEIKVHPASLHVCCSIETGLLKSKVLTVFPRVRSVEQPFCSTK